MLTVPMESQDGMEVLVSQVSAVRREDVEEMVKRVN